MNDDSEPRAVARRYARRAASDRYSPLRPENWQSLHERQRAMIDLFHQAGLTDLATLRLAEVGCGSGANLLELQRLGFAPPHLTGLELLPERFAQARAELPAAVTLIEGDACVAPLPGASQDIVLASTVFSSLLDAAFQQRLAAAMWGWLKPGGAVLWYDFTMNNPRNPDVRGVPLSRVRQLFPQGTITHRRVTLAPPLARRVCAWNPALYSVLNTVPWLRTHVLAWIAKPNP